MEMTNKSDNDAEFIAELEACAKLLIDRLQSNNYKDASELIQSLHQVRDRHIYLSIGHLTRALHDAIVNFNIDAGVTGGAADIDGYNIRDASDRLHYVINMTQEAANRTMDRVESAVPIAAELGLEAATLRKEWQKLPRRELSKQEFAQLYTRMDGFLKQVSEDSDQLNQSLQAIILEQGFQDLTGQVLRKVIGLITDVEAELVNLVCIAGHVDKLAGIRHENLTSGTAEGEVEAEGPQIHAEKREDVVSGQDEVDDLLSSLGF